MKNCFVCDRIALIKQNKNRFFVKELASGYVVLGDYQYYKGYTLLLSRFHTNELHKLKPKDRTQFLEDMALVSEAVYKSFKPIKLNYELLGNTDSHLHWHIFPRYAGDPNPGVPTWLVPPSARTSAETIPSDAEIKLLKEKIVKEIDKLVKTKD